MHRSTILVAVSSARSQLFLPTDAPASTGSGGGAISAGIAFFVTVSCNIIAIRFYRPTADTDSTHTVDLWDVASHAKLSEAASASETGSGWQEVTLTTPVPLTTNKAYYVMAFSSAGYYGYTNSYFAAAAVTRGPITAYKDGTVPGGLVTNTGIYQFGASPVYPTNGFNANYWADPVVDV